jgi:hypothetical protein
VPLRAVHGAGPTTWSPAQAGEQIVARLLAAAACLGADLAVVVLVGVARAPVTTGFARGGTRLEGGPGDVGVVAGVARGRRGGRVADVGAAGVCSDALGQFGDLSSDTQASTHAYRPPGAGDALLDAACELVTGQSLVSSRYPTVAIAEWKAPPRWTKGTRRRCDTEPD